MRVDIKKRLEQIEAKDADWISRLDLIDYLPLDDYDNGDWAEVYFDGHVTVVRNKRTGEIRGVYNDRRSDDDKLAEGGKLEFL